MVGRPASDEKRVVLSKNAFIVQPSGALRNTTPSADELDERIGRFIARADGGEAAFDQLAVDLFAYQYAANEPYRRYCDRIGGTALSVHRWQDVPAVPTAAFAQIRLACFPPERARVTFLSSGTTHATRSRLELENAKLYDASLLTHFRQRVLPDAATMQLVALAPPFSIAPNSSLSYMLSKISDVFGTPRDGFFHDGASLDFAGAARALRQAEGPLLVIGTAFGFVHFFDRCRDTGERFSPPPGSRVVETGGFKGRSREVDRDELYGWFSTLLGVPRELCVSEYGMCELGSQWYDANLADIVAGRTPRTNLKVGPHWAKTLVVDRVTASPMPDGDIGLLQIFDLSNRGSVAAVLTGDLARHSEGGFELFGRASGEPPKGCSIAVDAALS
jgi:hypothetical protein